MDRRHKGGITRSQVRRLPDADHTANEHLEFELHPTSKGQVQFLTQSLLSKYTLPTKYSALACTAYGRNARVFMQLPSRRRSSM